MSKNKHFFGAAVIFCIFFLSASAVQAATVTWDGGGTTTSWHEGANWDSGSEPGMDDIVIFNATSTKDAVTSAIVRIGELNINVGYTGTIAPAYHFYIRDDNGQSGDFTINAGAFVMSGAWSSGPDGDFTLNGGTWDGSSGVSTFGGGFDINGGTFIHTSGNVRFAQQKNNAVYSCNGASFNSVYILRPNWNTTIGSDCTFPLAASPVTYGNTINNGVLNIPSGNWTHQSGVITNNGTITVTGSGDVSVDGLINNATGVFTMGGTNFASSDGLTLDSGGTFPSNLDVTFTGASQTINCDGGTFNSVSINTTSTVHAVTIENNCTLPFGANPTSQGRFFVDTGSSLEGTGTTWNHSGTLYFYGTGAFDFSGTTLNTTSTVSNGSFIAVAGATLTLPSLTTMTVGSGILNDQSGNLPDGIDLIADAANGTVSISAISSTFNSVTTTGTNPVAFPNITTKALTHDTPSENIAANYTINIEEDLIVNSGGTFSNDYTLRFNGTGAQSLTNGGTTTSSNLTVNKTTGTFTLNDSSSFNDCTLEEGPVNLDGNDLTCSGTFTVEDGATLQLVGDETVSTPTFNTGSTALYKGNGDASGDGYTLNDWSYKNLTIDPTDSQDSFSCDVQAGLEGDFESGVPPVGWTSGGDTAWTQDTVTFSEGSAAANTGAITDSQESWIKRVYTPAAQASIDFEWKVSSEQGYDYLLFCIDNDGCTSSSGYTERISGDVDWAQVSAELTAGAHSLVWKYVKDGSHSDGTDEGWIDNIGELIYDINVDQDLTISNGVFKSPGNLFIGGDFDTSSGTFYHKGAEVIFDDAAQTSVITGTTFNDLTVTTPGKVITFAAGSTKDVLGHLTLTGAAGVGNEITLQSSVASSAAFLNVSTATGSHDVNYVDASDSNASGGQEICAKNSTDSTGNTNWDFACTNQTPTADPNTIAITEEVARLITLTGSDPEGSPLTYQVMTSPSKGNLTGVAPNLTYTPSTNEIGADSFTFRVNDGSLNSSTVTIDINISNVQDAPTADDQTVNLNEDAVVPITLTGDDVDGDPITYIIVTGPSKGALSGSAPNLTFTPTANENGADSFTFKTNDGIDDSANATVTLNITPINDPPTVDAQAVIVIEDTPKDITITGDDVDGDPITFAIASQPTDGSVSIVGSIATFTPDADVNGADSFTVVANDGTIDGSPGTISITVTEVNDAPEVPTGFSPANGDSTSSQQPTVTWDASIDTDNTAGELKYEIRLGKNANPKSTYSFTDISPVGDESIKITDVLDDETDYYYVVRAIDPDGAVSPWSAVQTFYVNTELTPELALVKSGSIRGASLVKRGINLLNAVLGFLPIPLQVEAQTMPDGDTIGSVAAISQTLIGLTLLILVIATVAIFRKARNSSHLIPLLLSHPANTYACLLKEQPSPVNDQAFIHFKTQLKVGRAVFGIALFMLAIFITVNGFIFSSLALTRSIAADGIVEPNDTLTITNSYENTGDGDATSVVFTDYLPTGVSFVAGSGSLNGSSIADGDFISGSIISVQLGTITDEDDDSNNSGTVSYQVTIDHPYEYGNSLALASASLNANEIASPLSSNSLNYDVITSTISGSVDNSETGEGVPGVEVSLVDEDGNIVDTTETDANGDFEFDGLDGGDYEVEIPPVPGFADGVAQPISVDSGSSGSVDISLSPDDVAALEEADEDSEDKVDEVADDKPLSPKDEQTALDLIEDLNNGDITTEDLTPLERSLIEKVLFDSITLDSIGSLGYSEGTTPTFTIPGSQDFIEVSGHAKEGSVITLSTCSSILSAGETIVADRNNEWAANISTDQLVNGKNIILAQAELNGVTTEKKILGNFVKKKEAKLNRTFLLIVANLFIVLVVSLVVVYIASSRQAQALKSGNGLAQAEPVISVASGVAGSSEITRKSGNIFSKLNQPTRVIILVSAIVVSVIIIIFGLIPFNPERDATFSSLLDLPGVSINSVNDRNAGYESEITVTGETLSISGLGVARGKVILTICDGVELTSANINQAGAWEINIPLAEIPDELTTLGLVMEDELGNVILSEEQAIDIKSTDHERGTPNWLVVLLLIIVIILSNTLEWQLLKNRNGGPPSVDKKPDEKRLDEKAADIEPAAKKEESAAAAVGIIPSSELGVEENIEDNKSVAEKLISDVEANVENAANGASSAENKPETKEKISDTQIDTDKQNQ